MTHFASRQEFHQDNPKRNGGPQAELGVHWRMHGHRHKHRAAFIRETREVYAVCLGIPDNPVTLLGTLPEHQDLDSVLTGHAAACVRQADVSWIIARLEGAAGIHE